MRLVHDLFDRTDVKTGATKVLKVIAACDVGRVMNPLALLGQVDRALLEELAGIVGPVLQWSKQDAAAEVERTIQRLEQVHGVTAAARSKSSFRCA